MKSYSLLYSFSENHIHFAPPIRGAVIPFQREEGECYTLKGEHREGERMKMNKMNIKVNIIFSLTEKFNCLITNDLFYLILLFIFILFTFEH